MDNAKYFIGKINDHFCRNFPDYFIDEISDTKLVIRNGSRRATVRSVDGQFLVSVEILVSNETKWFMNNQENFMIVGSCCDPFSEETNNEFEWVNGWAMLYPYHMKDTIISNFEKFFGVY